jgi:hypothetical protein
VNPRATTTISVLRGTTTDGYGDPADGSTAVATGVVASILEQRQRTTTPVDGQPRVVRYFTARVPHGTDVRAGDRIKDEQTLTVYIVDTVTTPASPVRGPEVRLDLRRVT